MKTWKAIASTITYVFALAFVGFCIHEFFHLITLNLLGGSGNITYEFFERPQTHYLEAPSYEWIVDLSGGLLTALFLWIFWFWSLSTKTLHDTNLEVSAFSIGMGHLAYSFTELFTQSMAIGLTAFMAGFFVAGLFYAYKTSGWIYSLRKN